MSSLRYLFSGKARNVLPIQNKSLSGGATVCFKNVLAHIKCTVFSFAGYGLPNHWRYVIITYGGIRTRVKGGLKVHKRIWTSSTMSFTDSLDCQAQSPSGIHFGKSSCTEVSSDTIRSNFTTIFYQSKTVFSRKKSCELDENQAHNSLFWMFFCLFRRSMIRFLKFCGSVTSTKGPNDKTLITSSVSSEES